MHPTPELRCSIADTIGMVNMILQKSGKLNESNLKAKATQEIKENIEQLKNQKDSQPQM
jgi:hypothetical protein